MVAPDLRHQRHLGRLHRRRQQDRDPEPCQRQALLSARAGPGPEQDHGRGRALPASAVAGGLPNSTFWTSDEVGRSGWPTLPWLTAARQGIEEVFHRPPVLIGCGGSIPITAPLRQILGLDVLFVGFGLDDDRVHSPNEKFELACYEKGIRTHAAMLARFAELGRT